MRSKPRPSNSGISSALETDLCGFKISSPTMLASGVLGTSFDVFPRIIQNGCGAIVSKSVSLKPRDGYRNPTMTGVTGGYLNAIGLANPGMLEFKIELTSFKKGPVPIIISIFEDSAEHFADLVRGLDDLEFLGYELNLSCPHVKNVGSEIGSDPAVAAEIVKQAKKATSKPVFAKMPATIVNVSEWARSVESAGADAIVAINTIRAMKIDLETKKPILSNKVGGLSGPAIKPVAVRSVFEAYDSVRIPIVGVGGISSGNDAIEFFLAGASAVQIGSAIGPYSLRVFDTVNRVISDYLKVNSFHNVRELVGLAHH